MLPFPQWGGGGLFATFFSIWGAFFGLVPPTKFSAAPMKYLVPWNFKIMGLPKDNLKFSAQLLKQEIDLRGIPPTTINIVQARVQNFFYFFFPFNFSGGGGPSSETS